MAQHVYTDFDKYVRDYPADEHWRNYVTRSPYYPNWLLVLVEQRTCLSENYAIVQYNDTEVVISDGDDTGAHLYTHKPAEIVKLIKEATPLKRIHDVEVLGFDNLW